MSVERLLHLLTPSFIGAEAADYGCRCSALQLLLELAEALPCYSLAAENKVVFRQGEFFLTSGLLSSHRPRWKLHVKQYLKPWCVSTYRELLLDVCALHCIGIQCSCPIDVF
jgi:hypothetical protein